jgi:outer membrane protein assembly factor BamB
MPSKHLFLTAIVCLAFAAPLGADTPLQWAQDPHRNVVVPAEDLPDHLGDDNRLWHVELHNRNFFNIITIDGGRAYCGMSADNLPERQRSRNQALLCIDVKTGATIWQAVIDTGGGYGLSDVPLYDDQRVYVSAGGKLVCLDKETGQEIWNVSRGGPYFGVLHGPNGTGLLIGDYWWVPTSYSTGSDCLNWISNSIEAPFHPNIIVLDKRTGERVAEDRVIIEPFQHGQWGSLSSAVIDGQRQVFWGDGAGWVHAWKVPDSFESGKITELEEVWRCDANPADYRRLEDGTPAPYAGYQGYIYGDQRIGPCEIISAPTYYEGKLYVALGRDKAYSPAKGKRRFGGGAVVCIDPTGEGDVTDTHKVWTNTEVHRTFSTPSIVGDLLFISDHNGYLYCLDIADKGKLVWKRDIDATIWNYFQAVGDGKIYVMNEQRGFHIFTADREGRELFAAEMDAANNPQVGMTDGILLVGTRRHIAAYGGPEYMKTHEPMPDPPKRAFEIEEDDAAGGH